MSEQSHPITCQSCGKQLFGPVNYCPYCAVPNAVAAIEEKASESSDIGSAVEEIVAIPVPISLSAEQASAEHGKPQVVSDVGRDTTSAPVADSVQPSPVVQDEAKSESSSIGFQEIRSNSKSPEQNDEPASARQTVEAIPPVNSPFAPGRRPSPWKWVAGVIVLVAVIAGYLVLVPPRSPEPASVKPGESRREAARILARETLSQGTALSVTISNLPKLEGVLEAAQKLAEISPRYQEQLASAENTISAARDNRDKSLMAYLSKVIELGRYAPEDVTYALEVVRNGDLTARERIVAELVAEHVNSVRKSTKADPKKLLAGFSQRFKDFVD